MREISDMYRKWHSMKVLRGSDEQIDFLLDFIDMLHVALDKQVELTQMYVERLYHKEA